jgi:hypothetical protein
MIYVMYRDEQIDRCRFLYCTVIALKTPEKNPESDRAVTEIPKGGSRRRKGVKKGELSSRSHLGQHKHVTVTVRIGTVALKCIGLFRHCMHV